MKIRISETHQRALRHVGTSLHGVLQKTRLSVMYAVVGIIVAAAWIATEFSRGQDVQANTSNNASGAGQTTLQLTPPAAQEGQSNMNQQTSDVSTNTSTHVQSTDTGTTVTVNGSTQTVAPGQTFQQSYTSPDGTTHTDVQVSGSDTSTDNGQQSSSRSVNVHSHSSSSSSSNGTNEP